jgi:hypothetical protein
VLHSEECNVRINRIVRAAVLFFCGAMKVPGGGFYGEGPGLFDCAVGLAGFTACLWFFLTLFMLLMPFRMFFLFPLFFPLDEQVLEIFGKHICIISSLIAFSIAAGVLLIASCWASQCSMICPTWFYLGDVTSANVPRLKRDKRTCTER